MDDEKKPRADSTLDAMPESRVMELRDKLLVNTSHRELIEWLAVDCGVSPVSSSMLSRFYRRHCVPLKRDRRKFSVMKAEALGDAMRKDPVRWDDKITEMAKQAAFEFLDSGGADPEAIEKLLNALNKANKAQLDREKFELMKRKADAADEAKGVSDNDTLTAEEKAARLKQIFRMG